MNSKLKDMQAGTTVREDLGTITGNVSYYEKKPRPFLTNVPTEQSMQREYEYTQYFKDHLQQTLPHKHKPAYVDDENGDIHFGGKVIKKPLLPTDPKERKKIPLYSGLLKYFPDALIEIAKVSYAGNEQHNPGQPLHWAREKSTDQEDTLLRHLM